MQSASNTNLVRKQMMLSNENIDKIERIAKAEKVSIANVVRIAIDTFDPDAGVGTGEDSELMTLVSSRLKDAIADTTRTRKRLDKALTMLEARS